MIKYYKRKMEELMKEYRYITFKPNTSESQTELFSEIQYSMKNFDLKDCDELE